MHVSFVILHYLTKKDTIECVESILNNVSYKNYSIIIVDNGSSNKSGEFLQMNYKTNEKVEVVLSKENLGFAKGNNLGFLRAKNKYLADIIILMNNDMLIEQKNFLDVIIHKYKKNKFAVMGPNIISLIDNGSQNPQPNRIKSLKDARYQLVRHLILLVLNMLKVEVLLKKLLKIFKKEKRHTMNNVNEQINVQLHGSCLIFSPLYIQKFNGLYDKTFMYFEEDILYYLSKKNNLKMYYCPEIIIYHKEDSATNELINNDLKKNRFIYKHSLKSIVFLIRLMKEKDRMVL